ncbi:hypothetical protein ACPC54_18735 [Kitasatospora sp. NPDC094028]
MTHRHSAPPRRLHADRSPCPPEHAHTAARRPLTDGCPGWKSMEARCCCGAWEGTATTASSALAEQRRRHLATHPRTGTAACTGTGGR